MVKHYLYFISIVITKIIVKQTSGDRVKGTSLLDSKEAPTALCSIELHSSSYCSWKLDFPPISLVKFFSNPHFCPFFLFIVPFHLRVAYRIICRRKLVKG